MKQIRAACRQNDLILLMNLSGAFKADLNLPSSDRGNKDQRGHYESKVSFGELSYRDRMVNKLYAKLRKLSRKVVVGENQTVFKFVPEDFVDEESWEKELSFSSEERTGAYFALQAALSAGTRLYDALGAGGNQYEFWSVAEKLRLEKQLERDLKISDGKTPALVDDDEPKSDKEKDA